MTSHNSKAHPLPPLQIAQVLADLSDLNIAEPKSALNLISAHNPLPTANSTRSISKGPLIIPDSPLSIPRRGSGNLTPGKEQPPPQDDEDMARAKTLLRLYHMREKLSSYQARGFERLKEDVRAVDAQFRARARANAV